MKVSFYLLIFIVIIACLITVTSYKYKHMQQLQKISEKFRDVPTKPVITNVNYQNNSIIINWTKPTSTEPIIKYFILIQKTDDTTEAVYLHIVTDSTCTDCSYTIDNLKLVSNSNYYVSVMAINLNGASQPSLPFNFTTSSDTEITTPPPTSTPTTTPTYTSVPTPTLTLEDSIRMMQNERKVYLNNELQNMIVRADGIYEVDKTELAYPDTYLNDVKQSINTINDKVKKDLQEYRLNIHLASQKNN